MSSKPNAVYYDKVFATKGGAGNQIVRCTYPETNLQGNGSFAIGFGGSGDSNAIGKVGGSPGSYRLIIGGVPFTYVPDRVRPICQPTYGSTSSFPVAEGSFSWVTPHLYYAFAGNHFKVFAMDLGSPSPPSRTPIVDFQQVLPRRGADWPGPNRAIPLGTIVRPSQNDHEGYLYQATCPPAETACAGGTTGDSLPSFNPRIMTDTADGTVTWRNIGVGFDNPSTWNTIGGVSADDDVFVKGVGDAGGQGGPGALFVVAYKRSSNLYFLYNVGTGIISYFKCNGGSGFACKGGSWAETVLGMTTLPDRFVLHNVKVNKSGEWVVVVQDDCRFRTCSVIPGSFGPYLWKLSTTGAKVSKITSHPYGHWTEGFRLFANQNGDPGISINGRSFANPEDQFALNYSSGSVPAPADAVDAHPSWNYNDGSDTTPICTATVAFDWPYRAPGENEVVCYGTNPDSSCSSGGHALCRDVTKRFFHTYNPATCNQYDGFWSCWGIGALSQDGKYYAFTSNWGDTLGSTAKGGHGPGSCIGGFNFQKDHEYQVGDVFEPGNGTGNGHPNAGFTVFRVTVAGSSSEYPKGAWPRSWLPRRSAAEGFYRSGATILPPTSHNPCNHAFRVIEGGGVANGASPPDWKRVYGYSGSCQSAKSGGTVRDGGIIWTDVGEYVLGAMHLANLGRDDCRSDVFIGELK